MRRSLLVFPWMLVDNEEDEISAWFFIVYYFWILKRLLVAGLLHI